MKIYTKTGDLGETGLFGGERVRKDHGRICAYGAVDEVNAVIGWVRAAGSSAKAVPFEDVLKKIQNDLFNLGAVLATPDLKKLKGHFIDLEDVRLLEETIDRLDKELPVLKQFLLPGGGELAARFHVARTVCRRAEREIVALQNEIALDSGVIVYMNRLSDLLFVMARWANQNEKIAEEPWTKKEG